MKPKKRLLSLLLCVTMLFSLCPQSVSAEGSVGTACTHEHTDDCYMEVTECVHEHDENCYPKTEDSVSENDASPSNATKREPENCPHICTEESGCIIRTLNCHHEHDEDCASSPETAAPAEGTEDDNSTIQTATDSNGDYKIDTAIEKVKAMIDALPDVSELKDMDDDELSEVHEKAQDAYDAFEALTEEQQAELTEELAKLRDVLDFMANLTATTAYTKTYNGYTLKATSFTSSFGSYTVDSITDISIYSWNRNGNKVTAEMIVYLNGVTSTLKDCTFDETSCTTALSRNVTWKNSVGSITLKMTITRAAKSHTGSATCTAAANCTTCGTSYTAAHEYGDYQNDGTNHWKACKNCGNIADKAACSGGTATCNVKATCSTCGNQYGNLAAHNYSLWAYLGGNIHCAQCVNCRYIDDKHFYSCTFNGTPNCSQSVSCTKCGHVKTAPNDHDWGEWKSTGNGTHTRTCSRNNSHTETVACSGGTATCTSKAVCTTCKQEYGSVDSNNHNWSDWTSNNGTHTRTCSYNKSHTESGTCSGGTATCESAAICSTCQQEYEPKKEHNYTYTANAEQHSITESCDQGCNHSATVTLSAPNDLTYNGTAKEAVVTGSFKNVTTPTVTYNTDDRKAPTKVGNYTASITAGGQSVSVDFSIAKKSTTATVTVNGTYTYTGEQITPTNVTVKDGDGNIIDTKEYTLSYGENIEAGTCTVIATFDENGSYTVSGNSATGTFTIDPKPLTAAMISVNGNFTYDGTPKSPTVTVTNGGKTLVLSTDYTISDDDSGTAAKPYTLTVTGKGNYGGSIGKNWTVKPLGVTISGLSVENKTYDGTTTATITGTAVINGKFGNDDVTVQGGTAAFADKTAGTGKEVIFSGYSLSGADAGNYVLSAQPTAAADIAQKSVTVSGVTAADRDYKENDTSVALSGGIVDGVLNGDTVTVDLTDAIGTMENPDASDSPKSVTVSGAKLTGADAENYVLSAQPDGVTVTISRIAYNGITAATGSAKYGNSNTVDLSGLMMSGGRAEIGTASDSNAILSTYTILNDTSLKFSFQETAAVGHTATIPIHVSGCTNYTDYSIAVTLTVNAKDVPIVTAPAPVSDLTYNGKSQTLITAGSTTGGTMQYSLDSRTWSAELPKAKDADTYTVYYKVVGDAEYAGTAANSISVTIGKKAVTVRPKSYTITKGKTIPTFALEYIGLVNGDTVNSKTKPVFICYEKDGKTAVSTSTAAGRYTITWTNPDAFDFDNETNYTVTKETAGTLTINAKPASDNGSSGGGSSSGGGNSSGNDNSSGGGSSNSGNSGNNSGSSDDENNGNDSGSSSSQNNGNGSGTSDKQNNGNGSGSSGSQNNGNISGSSDHGNNGFGNNASGNGNLGIVGTAPGSQDNRIGNDTASGSPNTEIGSTTSDSKNNGIGSNTSDNESNATDSANNKTGSGTSDSANSETGNDTSGSQNSNTGSAKSDPEQPVESSQANADPRSNMAPWIVTICILTAALAILLLLKRRKEKTQHDRTDKDTEE